MNRRCLVLLALFLAGIAFGAEPPAVSLTAAASSSATPNLGEDLTTELARARAQLARLQPAADGAPSTPLLDERRNLTARWVLLLDVARQRTAVPPQAASAPAAATFPHPPLPPRRVAASYAVAEVDALRDRLDDLQARRRALDVSVRGLEARIAALLAARRKAEESLRLLDDQRARARDAGSQERLQAESELARLQVRIAALEIAQAETERTLARAGAAEVAAASEPIAREVEHARWRQQIDDAALARAGEASDSARAALAEQRRSLVVQLTRSERTLAATADPPPAQVRHVELLRGRLAALDELDLIEAGRVELWRQRRAALEVGPDRAAQAQARGVLLRSIEQLQTRTQTTADRRQLTLAALRTQRLQLEGVEALGSAAEIQAERAALEARQQEADAQETIHEQLMRLQRLLHRSLDDLDAATGTQLRPWYERVAEGLRQSFEAIWRYELFSVSESTQVAGRTVTLDYGITIGKSFGVLLLFIIGWLAASVLSRKLIAWTVRRLQLSPQLGRVLHRWLLSLLLLGVLIAVLKLARIPLAAFAFLGGALAIGVGFGTQNIIKNLISGVIILFERKIRVGDIVTIDGVSGTVSAVDLRATTVRGFDGIEAIVPNSQLLENRVGNWSYGSPVIRRAIVVGLRYGQDARAAADLICRCAAADPGVLPAPAPLVLFLDFGPDAQQLQLQYWMRLDGQRSGPQIDSDLRHAISETFAAGGFEIAFPQRDVHLDVAAPIEISLKG